MINKYYLYKGINPRIRGKIGLVTLVLADGFVEFFYDEDYYRVKIESLVYVPDQD